MVPPWGPTTPSSSSLTRPRWARSSASGLLNPSGRSSLRGFVGLRVVFASSDLTPNLTPPTSSLRPSTSGHPDLRFRSSARRPTSPSSILNSLPALVRASLVRGLRPQPSFAGSAKLVFTGARKFGARSIFKPVESNFILISHNFLNGDFPTGAGFLLPRFHSEGKLGPKMIFHRSFFRSNFLIRLPRKFIFSSKVSSDIS